MCLVFVRGIHEHETCDALRMIRHEDADIEPAAGGPHEHQSSVDSAAVDECGQLARDAACCSGRRARIAVTHSGPVVRANASESGDLRLDEAPLSKRAERTDTSSKMSPRKGTAGARFRVLFELDRAVGIRKRDRHNHLPRHRVGRVW